MTDKLNIRFQPPGPVASAFMHSTAHVNCIMGPIGSAKTSTALMRLILQGAVRQKPDSRGVRRFKAAVVRDTFRQLEKTTIPTWLEWVPKDFGEFTGGGGGRPAQHAIQFDLHDGTRFDFLVEFIGLNDARVEDVMRGWEGTAAYLNEADLLSPDVLTYIIGRLPRYPKKDADGSGGATTWWVDLDCNAPDTENWIAKDFVFAPKDGYKFFRQPSGLAPNAENLHNLSGGQNYYLRQMGKQPEWYIRRFIRNEFGYSRDGKPVYPEFNDQLHIAAQPLRPIPGLQIVLGVDAGGTPAAVFTQKMPDGQILVLDELVTDNSTTTGPTRFGEYINRKLAEPEYRAALAVFEQHRRRDGTTRPAVIGYGDPAAFYGGDRDGGDPAWMETLAHVTEIKIKPPPTNKIGIRLEAVRVPMTRLIDGQKPAILISPACVALRKGMNSAYRYRRIQLAGTERFDELPEKNEHSHVQDALQYALCGAGEFLEVTGRRERRERARDDERPARDYNPLTDWKP